MTERKPPGVSFESWIDRQIRTAQERGEFDNLPGAGKPIPDHGNDELWWLKNYVQREGLPVDALLPTPLQLRKEIDRLPQTVRPLRTEQAVRDAVEQLNMRIVDWLRAPSGPQVPVRRVDVDEVLAQWHASRDAEKPAAASPSTAQAPSRRSPWWHRFIRSHHKN